MFHQFKLIGSPSIDASVTVQIPFALLDLILTRTEPVQRHTVSARHVLSTLFHNAGFATIK
jgi:hypothetical protein